MKETKIFTINNPEIANDFLCFLKENEIAWATKDGSFDCLNRKFVFKCKMDETETRIAANIVKYGAAAYRSTGEYNKTAYKKLFLDKNAIPEIKELVFNNPATIIFWKDGTKTIVKTQNGSPFDKEKGFCMAVVKKLFGNEGNYYNIVDKWINKKAKVYDDSSKKKSNKTYDHKNEVTQKIRKDV